MINDKYRPRFLRGPTPLSQGKISKVRHNGLRKVELEVDALGNETSYDYCTCGALNGIIKRPGTALEEETTFVRDEVGNILETYLPDGTARTNRFDLLNRLTVTSDALGYSTNYYDNLSRLVASSNYFGQSLAVVYDLEDNVTSRTDANGVTVLSTYDDLHRIETRTYPDTGVEGFFYTFGTWSPTAYTNQLGKGTLYTIDVSGRKTKEIVAGISTNQFYYTPANDLQYLTDGKSNITTWAYTIYGQVANKWYADNATNLTYLYDANGRLTNRWSPAKGHTYYGYDDVGNLTSIDYPTSADVTLQYDAHYRVTNEVVASSFTSAYTYYPGGALNTEDGPFANDTLTYYYNAAGLRSGLTIQQPAGSFTNGYSYDAARRLMTLTSHSGTYSYDYHAANAGITASTHLIKKLTLPNTSYITNVFDDNGRWKRTTLNNSSHTELNDHEYVYNVGNQRTKHTRADDSYNTYGYDDAGQLWTVRTTNSVGTEVTTEKFGYKIDAGYNIATVTNNASTTSYTINNLNQNTSNYSFDSNGNPSSGSPAPWTFTFDDENRLTVATLSGTSKSEFYYDARSRMRKRLEYNWVASAWSLSTETRYVYDGMLAVQHRNGSDVPTETLTRGPDLSGTLEGAGGIGGMRARTTSYNSGTGAWTTHHYYQSDANGNNTYLVNSSQALAGKYTYDPYGNSISSSGLFASGNPYRFSSKELHTKTGFYYYGYRFHDPINGRWLNRDPIEEEGGPNLYSFSENNSLSIFDAYGLRGGRPATPGRPGRRPGNPTTPGRRLPEIPINPVPRFPPIPPNDPPAYRNPPGVRVPPYTPPNPRPVPPEQRPKPLIPKWPYQLYPECPKNFVTICHKTDDWFEPHPTIPDTGERLCKYKCNDGQVHVGSGTECDEQTITIPSK